MPDVLVDHIRAVLFDVDGTLYRQGPVRRAMLSKLAGAYWRRPGEGARVARALGAYRRAQEELRSSGFIGDVTREQLDHAARKTGVDADVIAASVERWMETTPLAAVAASGRHSLVDTLDALAARGLMLGAVSDYPAERKLEALGIRDRFAVVISAQDPRVHAFKPNPRGLLVAAESLGIEPGEALYIGDRSEVDAAAAAAAQMACLLVGRSRRRTGPHDETQWIDELGGIVQFLERG